MSNILEQTDLNESGAAGDKSTLNTTKFRKKKVVKKKKKIPKAPKPDKSILESESKTLAKDRTTDPAEEEKANSEIDLFDKASDADDKGLPSEVDPNDLLPSDEGKEEEKEQYREEFIKLFKEATVYEKIGRLEMNISSKPGARSIGSFRLKS